MPPSPGSLVGSGGTGAWRDIVTFVERLGAAIRREQGQGLAEYALSMALVSLIAIAALLFLGQHIAGTVAWMGAYFDFFLHGTPMP